MLADEVRLDLVNRTTRQGRAAVGEYFHRYDQADDWQLGLGAVEGHPAILVYTAGEPQPAYFILLTWEHEQIACIRDYRHARYIMRDAEIQTGAHV